MLILSPYFYTIPRRFWRVVSINKFIGLLKFFFIVKIENYSINFNQHMDNKFKSDEPIGFTVDGIIARAGGCAAVAKELGLAFQTVSQWNRRIPSTHAFRVAIMAGLPIEIVRPDLAQTGHIAAINNFNKKEKV